MTTGIKHSDIVAYLIQIKALVSKGKYDFVPRRKNMLALSHYGLTIQDVKDEILSLTINDYYKGPKQDYNPTRPGDIWEFKKNIDNTQFYIKVKITEENGADILKCLSFHEDDFAQEGRPHQ